MAEEFANENYFNAAAAAALAAVLGWKGGWGETAEIGLKITVPRRRKLRMVTDG